MNIFVTNPCPIISAQTLDNKRVIKMAIETGQMLSTAIFINSSVRYDGIYRPTHQKHPCTIWASHSRENWDWLFQHFIALCDEYHLRYKKEHASRKIIQNLLDHSHSIKKGTLTPFVNCTKSEAMNIDFRHMSDVYEAYKQYMIVKWNHDKLEPKWTNRSTPLWYIKT